MFTIHHWTDRVRGLRELGRVSRRQVALVYEPAIANSFWLVQYFDGLITPPPLVDPTAEWVGRYLHVRESRPVLVPSDCTDGFTGCYWNRPERYLDPAVQAGMSTLARLSDDVRQAGTARLRTSLENGEWDRRFGHLRALNEFDIGYRLVICES